MFESGIVFAQRYVAVTEVHTGCEPEVEVSPETVIYEAVYTESGLKRRLIDEPLFTCLGDKTVVSESEILSVDSDGKTEMPPTEVSVRSVHQLVVEVLTHDISAAPCKENREQKKCAQKCGESVTHHSV